MPDIRNRLFHLNVSAYLLFTLCSAVICILFAQRAAAEETVTLAPIVVTAK
jgi:hypothetical protein